MEKEGERRARSFVSRGAEAGIQALLSGTPFLRVSTLSSGRVSYVKDFLPRSPSSSSSSSLLLLRRLLLLPPQLLVSSPFRF